MGRAPGRGRAAQHGQHVVTLRSTNQGRTWSAPLALEPADGAALSTTTVTLRATYADGGAGVDLASLLLTGRTLDRDVTLLGLFGGLAVAFFGTYQMIMKVMAKRQDGKTAK
mgnify:CR=1 FL=1